MSDERVVPGVTDITNVQKHVARYALALGYCNGKDVLDVSCGVGYGSQMLSWVANKVVGVDIDDETIKIANDKYVSNNVDFRVGDLCDGSFGEYDVVVSFETLEHIKDIYTAQESIISMIKPGGRLIYSVPLYENYDNEFHHHTFDLDQGVKMFVGLIDTMYMIQDGTNFHIEDKKKPFTYLIVTKIKPF